jgi:cell division protein FtsL
VSRKALKWMKSASAEKWRRSLFFEKEHEVSRKALDREWRRKKIFHTFSGWAPIYGKAH